MQKQKESLAIPWNDEAFLLVAGENKTRFARVVRTVEQFCAHILLNVQDYEAQNQQILADLRSFVGHSSIKEKYPILTDEVFFFGCGGRTVEQK